MVYRMSSIIGQDWRPKTWRELFLQWQHFQMDRWMHTAAMRASWSSKKIDPAKLNPYVDEKNGQGSGSTTEMQGIKVEGKRILCIRRRGDNWENQDDD